MESIGSSTLARLSAAEVRRLKAAAHELEASWPGPELMPSVARCVADAFDGEHVSIMYMRAPDGGLGEVGQTLGAPHDDWRPWRGAEAIPRHARYDLARRDPWADRPVRDAELFEGRREALERFRADVLEPNGVWHQLRVTLYQEDRFVGFVGLFRPRDATPFDARDEAALGVLVPTLRELVGVAQIFHGTELRESGVLSVLDALDRPALLTTPEGVVVYANPLARTLHPGTSALIEAVATGSVKNHPLLTAAPLRVSGLPLRFVQYRRRVTAHPGIAKLPPSLARVGALMAQGLADKEIAVALDLPVSTVRTYAQRVLSRLGLHDRRELILLHGNGAG